MGTRVRPLEVEDVDVLSSLDAAYAEQHGLDSRVTLASANFHARSGHSFVLEEDGVARGFVLAHAVWNGHRPIVRATRMIAPDTDAAGRTILAESLTKSAYDAAVYDIEVEVPETDAALRSALDEQRYRSAPILLFRRTLGSRGADSS